MTSTSRGMRFVWFLGFVLLLGTAIGAGWVFNQPAASSTPNNSAEPKMLGFVGIGFVDSEDGITFLHPIQPGRVANVYAKEGDQVNEGGLILSLENEFQKIQLGLADADLELAKIQLREAEGTLVTEWKNRIAVQTSTLQAARDKLKTAESKYELTKKQYPTDPKSPVSKDYQAIAEQEVEIERSIVKAQEGQLELITAMSPQGKIDSAKVDIKAKEKQRDKARQALLECDLYAPADGTILRLFATPGEILNGQPRQFAVQFCPDRPRIVRVEILQEWASQIKEGMLAEIEDDTRASGKWKGKVERVSKWFSPRRSLILEPFQYNDARTLECIVYLEPGSPLRIGQRVRAILKSDTP